jgi:hypothetical protein
LERRSVPFPTALAEELAALMTGKAATIWSSPIYGVVS